MRTLLFAFLFFAFKLGSIEISKTTFHLSNEPIDVVIPCAPKDVVTLEMCIDGIRENGINIRRVIVVSKERLTNSAEWFDESKYPFNFRLIALEIFDGDAKKADKYLKTPGMRIGWVFQQLLKLYAINVIPDISSNVLILDSDVIFLNPTKFMNEAVEPFFNTSKEKWTPYFIFGERLINGWKRVYPKISGVCHYMLFQKEILDDMFAKISLQHNVEPWKAICRCIDKKELRIACMSEYELYFNYALLRTEQAHLRPIKWVNLGPWDNIEKYRKEGFRYMACQEWMRSLNIMKIDIYSGDPENENVP